MCMKTLTGEIWNPARQRLRIYKPLKKSYLRGAEVCERPESGMLTVVIMVSPTGTTWNPLIAQLTAFETLKNAHL